MAVGVVVDATAAYLQRQGLSSVADGAVLAAADAGSRNEAHLYGEGIGVQESLQQQRALAHAAVVDHLRATRAHGSYPGLTWELGFDASAERVTLRVRAPLDLPLTVPGSPERTIVSAEASAVVRLD
ncbi:hypothetical protein K6T13_13240 [Nocardioides coralli]|nr:hypothetical protein K6T13_13240 [Nocardioides coralli]